MLELASVSFAYPHQQPIFDRFTWRATKGETWAVLGPSGCGKTTLLYLLAGLRQPLAGRVLVHGLPMIRPRPQTGLILQDYGLLPWATVRQNAALGLDIRRFYGPDGTDAPRQSADVAARLCEAAPHPDPADVHYWLNRLGLLELAEQYPAQLSGGQRQRTAIARTLVLRPDLLLLDEPFASLDAPTRESLQALMLDLCRENSLTLVVVTHAIEEAAILGEKILLLGAPPHLAPQVIPNPGMKTADYRSTSEYTAICRELRACLG